MQLREVFKCWGVGTDPKKSAEGTLQWQSLGADQLGAEGVVGSARKFRRALLCASLELLGNASTVRCESRDLLSLVGKHMHSVQYCRPLASCFDEVYKAMNSGASIKTLPLSAVDDLMMVTGMLPQHWMDQRLQFSPVAYATDASEEGGGACSTIGLTARGRAKCHMGCCESFDYEGGQADPVVLIEAFGGIGGLRRSMELLGVMPLGIIFIDSDPMCIKLAKKHCAFVITVDDIKKVDKKMILDWRRLFPRAAEVVLGGGWPCVNHSSLNKNRQGAAAASSRLLDDLLRIAEDLKTSRRALKLSGWQVIEFYENVVMDETDLVVQSEAIGCDPIFVEAAEVLHCRRPRLFWIKGLEVIEGKDLVLYRDQQV